MALDSSNTPKDSTLRKAATYSFTLPSSPEPEPMNVRILRKGNRRIVAGPASVAIPDQEGDLISGQALAKALPEFIENSLISLNHMDVKIGDILKEYSDGSRTYRTEVRPITADDLATYGILKKGGAREGDIAFFLVAEFKAPADPEHYANKTWNEILKGELSCFSISGQALGSPKQGMKCDGLTCKMVNIIDSMAASAITVCKQGVNQAAGFNIVSKNITSGDDDMDMKFSEARKALLAKGTPEAIKQVAAMDDLLANFLSKAKPEEMVDAPVESDKDCDCKGECTCKAAPKLDSPAPEPAAAPADCGCSAAPMAKDEPKPEVPLPPVAPDAAPVPADAPPMAPDAAPAPEAAPAVPVGTSEAELVDPAQAPEGAQVSDPATPQEGLAGDEQVSVLVSAPISELQQALQEASQAVSQMMQEQMQKSLDAAIANLRKELTGSGYDKELWDLKTGKPRLGYPSQPSGHSTHLAQSDESAVERQKEQSEDWNDASVNFEYPSGSDRQKDSPAMTVRIAGDNSRQHGMADEGKYPESAKVGSKFTKKAATKQQFQEVGGALGTVGGGALGGVLTRNPKGAAAGAAVGGPLGHMAGGKVADKLHIKEMDEKGMTPKVVPQRPAGQGVPPTAATQPAPTKPIGKGDDAVQQAPGKKDPSEKMEAANAEMDMELFQKPSTDGHSDAFMEVHKMLVEEKGVDRQLAHQVASLVCGKQYFSKCFTCTVMDDKYDRPDLVFDGFKKAKDYGTVGFGLLSKHDTRLFMAEYTQALELAEWAVKAWQAQRSKRGTLMAVNSDNPNAKPLYGEKAARALAAQRRMGGQEQQTLEGGQAQPSGAGLTGNDVASSYLEAAGVDAADVPKLMAAIGQSSKGEIRGASGLQAAKQAINQALQSLGYAPEGQISDDMARKLVNASMQSAGTSNMTYEEPTGGGEEMQPEMPQPSQNPVKPAQDPKVEQAKNRVAAEPATGFTGGDMAPSAPGQDDVLDDGPAGVETGITELQPNVLTDVSEHEIPEDGDPMAVADTAVQDFEQQQEAEAAAQMQNPEVQAMQAEQQMAQEELEQDKQRHASEMQMEQQRMQHDMQLEQTKLQQEMKLNEQRAQVEQQQSQARMQQEQQMAQQKFQHDASMSQQQMQQDAAMAQQPQADPMAQQQPTGAAPMPQQDFGADEGLEGLMPHEDIADASMGSPFDDAAEYRDGADGDAAMQEIMDGIAADEAHFAQQGAMEVPIDESGMAPEELEMDPMAGMNEQAVAERGIDDAMAQPTVSGPAATMNEDGMAEEMLAEEPMMEPEAAPMAPPAAAPAPAAGGAKTPQQLMDMARQKPAAAPAPGMPVPAPAPAAAPAAAEPEMELDGESQVPMTDQAYSSEAATGQSAFPKPRADTKRYWKEVSPADLPAVQQFIQSQDMRQSLPADAQAVQVNPDPRSYDTEPVARYIGKDGKPHAIYTHSYYEMTADPKKFQRVEANRPALQQFINQQFQMLGAPADSRERDVALMSLVAAETGMRRGNAQSAQSKGTYGITTVPAQAVQFQGGKAIFSFKGKGGVDQTFVVQEPRLVEALQQQVQMSRQMGRTELFATKSIHAYSALPAATRAKFHDFRTMKGTDVARDAVQRLLSSGAMPRDEASLGQFMRQVHEAVAKQLGNTPEVAGESYVDPAVFNEARAGMGGGQAPSQAQPMPVKKGFQPPQEGAVQANGLDEAAYVDEDEALAMEDADGAEYAVPGYLQAVWQQAFGGEQAPKTMLVPPAVIEEILRDSGAGALLDQLKQQSGADSGAGFKSPEAPGTNNPGGFDQAAY